MGFWAFLRRLFGREASAPPAARARTEQEELAEFMARATVPPELRLVASTSDASELAAFDFAEGCDYAPIRRLPLVAWEEQLVERLAAELRRRFSGAHAEAVPPPTRASRIFSLLGDPDFAVEKLVQFAQRDPALSASLLRVANSAAFAGVTPIESLRDAIVRLGAQNVAGIVTALSSRSVFDTGARSARGPVRDAWTEAWQHAVATAFTAGGLALDLRTGDLEQCFLAGMLHDIGKTFALRELPAALADSRQSDVPSRAVVDAVVDAVHVEFGAIAARTWKLPEFVVDACEKHHELGAEVGVELPIVRLGSGLAAMQLSPHYPERTADELRETATRLKLGRAALRAQRTAARANVVKARAL